MLLQKVRSILKKDCSFPDERKFLVGISGGPDSVCLLDVLSQLPYEIVVGHLNHNLRPSSSEEMAFVEKIATKYGCKFIGKTANILKLSELNKVGIEETARKERYRFLFSAAQNENAAAVFVAHQADDQIETLLMNLIRGAGLEGMSGMRVISISEFHPSIPLVRPLLKTWREDIMNYCRSHRLEFRLDESNQSLTNTRVNIRNHLIPELAKYNPNIKVTLLRTQQVMEEDFNYFQESISAGVKEIHLTSENDTVYLDLSGFRKLPKSLQRLVIKDTLEKYFFGQETISFSNIEYARKMFAREIKRSSLKISDDLYAFTTGGRGILTKSSECGWDSSLPRIEKELKIVAESGKYPIGIGWQLEIEEIPKNQISEDYRNNKDPFKAYIDKDQVKGIITIRPWIKGDRFRSLGMNGKSIKLSDYWINRKVSPQARVYWPLVLYQDEIIWIPGFQQSHNTRITDETQNIIIFRLKSNA
ncbi:MAG: tRNA lysidine(34) synthetase TilS [Pelolinea sp.]|nr:tRNA lysidine(34) synthetase TilS [Pelolinea sp.]